MNSCESIWLAPPISSFHGSRKLRKKYQTTVVPLACPSSCPSLPEIVRLCSPMPIYLTPPLPTPPSLHPPFSPSCRNFAYLTPSLPPSLVQTLSPPPPHQSIPPLFPRKYGCSLAPPSLLGRAPSPMEPSPMAPQAAAPRCRRGRAATAQCRRGGGRPSSGSEGSESAGFRRRRRRGSESRLKNPKPMKSRSQSCGGGGLRSMRRGRGGE